MSKRREAEAARARAAELHAKVHGPNPAATVADLVRAELDRQRRAEADERRAEAEAKAQAEFDRFVGGPCWACGSTYAEVKDVSGPLAGVPRPDWNQSAHGPECGTCTDWRGMFGTDAELLDLVAWIVRFEPLGALENPNRPRRQWEPGLAVKLGVVPWINSGAAPGVRWGHLDGLKRELDERLAEIGRRPQVPNLTKILEDTAHLPGREFMTVEQEQRLKHLEINFAPKVQA